MKEPSEKRPTLPAPLRTITVQILATWTPEQALAVFDRLDDLREKIRIRYRGQRQDLLEEQLLQLKLLSIAMHTNTSDRLLLAPQN